MGADFFNVVNMMKEDYLQMLYLQLPIGKEDWLEGGDLLEMRLIYKR